MLRNIKDMEESTVTAIDGVVGRVRDFYFDDESWVIRYVIVETHERLPRRRVLIEKVLPVSITEAAIRTHYGRKAYVPPGEKRIRAKPGS